MTPALFACWYRTFFLPPMALSTASLVVGVSGAFAVPLVCGLLTGRLDTNTGLYFRKSEPVRYWMHVVVLTAGVLFPAVALMGHAWR
ncbi:hypothetical protein [Verrucomicrobium sp. BvORR106]|uniref:hypothetical protein n=1 Tax=Verrucomicrobium sp. BvORR106 TaxID=1403819 RepID=UPI0005703E65|nr:hypothetical protein [Verrucomicrobium sp. BvORR106]